MTLTDRQNAALAEKVLGMDINICVRHPQGCDPLHDMVPTFLTPDDMVALLGSMGKLSEETQYQFHLRLLEIVKCGPACLATDFMRNAFTKDLPAAVRLAAIRALGIEQ